ncbi:hypothetical protein DM01DRAFT_1329156 [Hesseltinella vesiculosa]|uniref:Uncharacterized protein n=1 Tax=Hesseltinella vesiculosa TaxID=101127 RepID=A0A1X2G4B0_9FUNG|nr:hypothetical protein DM01DRAFT_1329156 [Hesseltinella vesiculosa]
MIGRADIEESKSDVAMNATDVKFSMLWYCNVSCTCLKASKCIEKERTQCNEIKKK